MNFKTWLETFISEKGLDLRHEFTCEGREWGINFIPLDSVVEFILLNANKAQKAEIKTHLVKMDFVNAPIMPFFEEIAVRMAKAYG